MVVSTFSIVGSSPVFAATTMPSGSNIKLTEDIYLSSAWQVSGNVTIDLNGHTITRNLSSKKSDGEVIYVKKNANLVINDSVGTGKITGGYSSNGGGGVQLYGNNNSTFIMNCGSVKNNNTGSNYGGGIYVSDDYHIPLIVKGGTISNNTATTSGGGVYIQDGAVNFTSSSSTSKINITNNYAGKEGGGIYCNDDDGTTISDVYFSGNTAKTAGGGVYINTDNSASAYVDFDATENAKIKSVYNPDSVTVANGTSEANILSSLPSTVDLMLENGRPVSGATVNWNGVTGYDSTAKALQNVKATGTVTVPSGYETTTDFENIVSVDITVLAYSAEYTGHGAINSISVEFGEAIALPATVKITTNDSSYSPDALIDWDYSSSTYDPTVKTEQTFKVPGKIVLPEYVTCQDSSKLSIEATVTMGAEPTVDTGSVYKGVADNTITGVEYKSDVTAMELPSMVVINTSKEDYTPSAVVTWDYTSVNGFDPSKTEAQTFTINGTITLPADVVNSDNIDLTQEFTVTVNAAGTVVNVEYFGNETSDEGSANAYGWKATVNPNGNILSKITWVVKYTFNDVAQESTFEDVIDTSEDSNKEYVFGLILEVNKGEEGKYNITTDDTSNINVSATVE